MKAFSRPCARNPWTEGKRFVVQKKYFWGRLASRNTWQSAVQLLRKPWKTFFAALVIQTTTSQLLFYPFFYARRYFVTALKLAFLSVITGRSCCLVTNQCGHFGSFNVRSVVLREICEVWCIADKFDLDWTQLVLFPRFLCFRNARKLYSYF